MRGIFDIFAQYDTLRCIIQPHHIGDDTQHLTMPLLTKWVGIAGHEKSVGWQ